MRHQIAVNSTITQVDTAATQPLGSVQEFVTSGSFQTWVYVKNAEGATAFAAGTPVAAHATSTALGTCVIAPADCPSVRVVGVAQHAIAAGSFGWILARGVGVLTGNGSITASTAVDISGTAGQAVSVSAAVDSSFAFALTEDAAAGSNCTAVIRCQGV